ncbi:transketolase [Nocardiopsis sp. MG754419]|uniref:transketolase n=1 Tax=Nocardiopsis sp. MG754419 TaxID=2259865 RepID=UPI001BACE3CB|nr:transketolase [Nocardiopsis sp. MG754419]MBR8740764.1 transketolase [Nocardiopsis sp. MG754419]
MNQTAAEPEVGIGATRTDRVRDAAYRIRANALTQGEVQGQGYIGQALGIADVLAALYADHLNLRPEDPEWEDRDRFLLSIGHYAIALYAALAEAGVIPVEELSTYATDDSRLPMSGMSTYTPGMEVSGGSLGHGLGVAVGIALGLRRKDNPAHVYNLLSDGELSEGSTWEAVQACAHHGLDNVIAIVDMNRQVADGPAQEVMGTEPADEKFRVNGWHVLRVDGNDVDAVLTALDELRSHRGSPKALICDTVMGKGIPMLESREKLHFMRVAEDEWQIARDQLKEGHEA